VAEFTFHRGVAVRAGVPGPDVWIVLRRTWGEAPELKGYLSNAPGHPGHRAGPSGRDALAHRNGVRGE
jgi:hypothetical protein